MGARQAGAALRGGRVNDRVKHDWMRVDGTQRTCKRCSLVVIENWHSIDYLYTGNCGPDLSYYHNGVVSDRDPGFAARLRTLTAACGAVGFSVRPMRYSCCA